jgi:hypothetical protein
MVAKTQLKDWKKNHFLLKLSIAHSDLFHWVSRKVSQGHLLFSVLHIGTIFPFISHTSLICKTPAASTETSLM